MSRKLIAILALVCAALAPFVPAGNAQDTFKIPPEEAKKVNPLKNDASTIADGKKLYSSQCYLCHGKDGDGKGELAKDMKLKLDDFHDPTALKDKTDGELFYILSKGKGDMPGEGDRLSETQRWQLIAFIRSLAGKPMPAAAPAKDEKKPD
jgi:mono/diheme cytochrome c family protein